MTNHILYLLLFLTLHPHPTISTTSEPPPSPTTTTTTTTIQCSSTPHSPPQPIPPSHLNDNYCDCPYDNGIDEVLTSACAGSNDWIGLTSPSSSFSKDEGIDTNGWFTCTQQPDLHLPPSRINDGVCDCCDGSDESSSTSSYCPDNCAEILEQQRTIRLQIQTNYSRGKPRHGLLKLRYDNFVQDTQEEIAFRKEQLLQKQRELEELETALLKRRTTVAEYRLGIVNALLMEELPEDWLSLSLLLEENKTHQNNPKHTKEWLYRKVITSACRFAGEITHYEGIENRYGTTCGPLRLAGLDLGLYWDGSDEGVTTVVRSVVGGGGGGGEEGSERNLAVIAEIGRMWIENQNKRGRNEPLVLGTENAGGDAADVGEERLSNPRNDIHNTRTKKTPNSEPIDDDDEYFDENWYHEHEAYENDDVIDDGDDDDEEADVDVDVEEPEETEDTSNTVVLENDDGSVSVEGTDPVLDSIEEPKQETETTTTEEEPTNPWIDPFRYHFYIRAKTLIDRIDEVTNTAFTHEENPVEYDDVAMESDGTIPTPTPTAPSVDPMELSLLRTTLIRRIDSLEHGAVLASSASTLLTILDYYRSTHVTNESDWILLLSQLTALTIYYADMGSADVVEAVRLAMIDPPSKDSCVSLYNVLCPNTEKEKWPTGDLKVAVEARCLERKEEGIHLCELEEEGEEVGIESDTFPSEIDDGYYNYYELEERDEDDSISKMFQVVSDISFDEDDQDSDIEDDDRDTISAEISKLEQELSKLEETLRDATDPTDPKYGPDGILYSLRDSCFSHVAGKYTYEVCLFGKAYQKDSGANTILGTWAGIERRSNDDDGRGGYVMKWKNGAKCWNGPVRTATVYVTCGGTEEDGETMLVSADEPNVCEYELRMESPIACDETYALKHGLEP